VKEKAGSLIKSKLKLEDIHFAAAVLCPNTRTLPVLEERQRDRAKRVILRKMKEIAQGMTRNVILSNQTKGLTQRKAKKIINFLNFLFVSYTMSLRQKALPSKGPSDILSYDPPIL